MDKPVSLAAKKKFRLLLLFLVSPFFITAQQPAFKIIPPQYELEYIRLNNKDDIGLFNDIAEDNEGNLWLSGTKGFHVFDGNHTVSYSSGKTQYSLLPDSSLHWLYWIQKDKAGHFWIQEGEKRYLNFDTRRRKLLATMEEKTDTADAIYTGSLDGNDNFYSVTINIKNKTFSIACKKQNQLLQPVFKTNYTVGQSFAYHFSDNNHWLFYRDILRRVSADGKIVKEYKVAGGNSFLVNKNIKNLYVINSKQDAVYIWNSAADTMELFAVLPASVIKNKVNGFYVWGDKIYLASNRYCFIIDRSDNSLQDLTPDFVELIKKEAPGSMGINFMTFFMKSDSSLLLCTQSNIYRLKKKVPPVTVFKETQEATPGPVSYRALAQDEKKNIYVSYYTGIAKKSAGSKNFVPLATQQYLNGDLISTYSLNYNKGYLLWNNVKIDIASGRHTYMFGEKFSGHTAQYLRHDTLWMFQWNTNELYCYDLLKNKLSTFSIDKNLSGINFLNAINDITEDATGKNLWIATSLNGLALITKEARLLKQYSLKELGISDNYITSLLLQHDIVWFGCVDGLGSLNTITGKIVIYKNPTIVSNGILQNRNIFSILPDSTGNFYLGSSHGLIYFDTKNHEFYNLPEGHPLSAIEFNRSSTLRAADGHFYFGSIDGLFSFLPSQLEFIRSSNKLKPIKLNAVAVFSNRENRFRYLTEDLDSLQQLLLEPGDNNIELDLAVPEFYKKVYYSYRIKEQGNQWTDYKLDNKILLYGLQPGNYTLEVKASTALSDEHAVYYSLPVIMQQLWYKKSWVIALFFVGIIALITGLLRYRYNQKIKRQKDLAALRTKISSDLHDDVGTILSGLAMQSQMLTYTAKEEQKQSLLEISSMSRDAMEHMRDTVWAMDSRKDKYENLIDRMRDFAEKNLSMKKMTHEFIISDIDTKKFINPEKRQTIYLIFKEAITNIIKHCDGKHVTIQFAYEKNRLHLTIQDNGTEKEGCNSDGLGMSNMKMRAEKIGGTLTAKYENGFVVELTL